MAKRFWLPMRSGLLSFSAMSKFQECPRKWALQYIDNVQIEQEEGDGLLRGRAFHEAIETNDPEQAAANLKDQADGALVRAASRKYLEAKQRGDFPKVTHVEQKIINEERQFIGYVDEMSIDDDNGNWMIGEMKTTKKFNPVEYAIMDIKPQTALYKAMSTPFCSSMGLSVKDFAGLSCKKIVFPGIRPLKGRGKNAVPEAIEDFEKRAYDGVAIYHKIVKVTERVENDALLAFQHTLESIDHLGADSSRYPKHSNSCLHPYFGICPFFQTCHGINLSLNDDIGSNLDCNELPD